MITESDFGWRFSSPFGEGLFARATIEGESLDVSLSRDDREEILVGLARQNGWSGRLGPFSMVQVHGARVVQIEGEEPALVAECDALVTDLEDTLLTALTADCVPLALFAEGAVSVVHAGWRGLAEGVIHAAVLDVCDLAGVGPENVFAFVGPAAGVCCYEVGDEVLQAIGATAVHSGRMLSSSDTAIRQLLAAGVSQIEAVEACTICADPSVLNSFRRDGDNSGRQGVLAWLSS